MYRTFPGVDRTIWEATIMTKILMLLWSSRRLWLPLETLPLFEAAMDVIVFFLAKEICSFDSNTFNWSSKDSGPFWDTLYRLLWIVKLDCLKKYINDLCSAPIRDWRLFQIVYTTFMIIYTLYDQSIQKWKLILRYFQAHQLPVLVATGMYLGLTWKIWKGLDCPLMPYLPFQRSSKRTRNKI